MKNATVLLWIFGLLVLLAIPLVVVAGTVSVPNTFVNGEVADADEVNANFDAVETEVNDNDSRITAAQNTADAAVTIAAAAQAAADVAAAGHATDTTLNEAAVDAFVADNGYSSGAHTVDTTLNEATVDAFVANNGYAVETVQGPHDRPGNRNTAVGYDALLNNTGDYNTAVGDRAGQLTTGSDNIMIGNEGVAMENSTIRIGTSGTHTQTHLVGEINFPCGTLVAIQASACPFTVGDAPACSQVPAGSMCEWDLGDCPGGSDINNCGSLDIYFKSSW